ncbi:PREDICTED: cytochrome c oxidase subunit 5A, mitochondrial-like [Priapulus caudatus]|uniref:Cytochrome c oxidase subunit 5A, mitochondrial n=1 Tax=Priapulus caudatus TaxID=37621 RepID=A0ABM1E5M5_PRICU|nr:PREDICTED: cytochrome c oxidase subunit 5A, mitochondrial-like [Priapulus caudatus]
MLRNVITKLSQPARSLIQQNISRGAAASLARGYSSKAHETDEEFDRRYEAYFNRPDIDGWEIRKGINDLCGHDLVPEPQIISAALRACRRVNDYALAVRVVEAMKNKCGNKEKEIYPWLLQEIRPTLDELGINTPEELGYDKPELWLEDVHDIH